MQRTCLEDSEKTMWQMCTINMLFFRKCLSFRVRKSQTLHMAYSSAVRHLQTSMGLTYSAEIEWKNVPRLNELCKLNTLGCKRQSVLRCTE